MKIREVIQVILGNLGTLLWFFPLLGKKIHQMRGVVFVDLPSVFLSRNVLLDNRYPELIYIGRDVWLTQGVTVIAHSYHSRYQGKKFAMQEFSAPVRIEDGVFIGVNSIILPGVTIGKGSYIGAGSVVTRNISSGMLAAGNPCREIHPLQKSSSLKKLIT